MGGAILKNMAIFKKRNALRVKQKHGKSCFLFENILFIDFEIGKESVVGRSWRKLPFSKRKCVAQEETQEIQPNFDNYVIDGPSFATSSLQAEDGPHFKIQILLIRRHR